MAAEIKVTQLDQFMREVAPGTVGARLRAADRLFLEVRRPGEDTPRASWVLRYTYAGKKQSLGLGKYFPQGQTGVGGVTLAKAVKAAAEKLAEIDKGVQPVKAKRALVAKDTAEESARAAVSARTVRKAAEGWHEATKGELTSDKYRVQRLRRLEEYLEHIGTVAVERLTVAEVSGAFDELKKADKATGRKADRADTLRRSSADLEKAIEYAASKGWFNGANPVTQARKGLSKPKPNNVGHRAFTVDRLPAFVKDLAAAGTTKVYPVTERLLQLLALTAARTSEIRFLKWSEIDGLDGDKPMLHIPVERMKKRLAWSVPLTAQAVAILKEIKVWQAQVGGSALQGVKDGFVFVHLDGRYKGVLCSENSVNNLLQGMGWGGELVGHGLRKVFSTVAHDCWAYHGANRTEAVEFSMAHVHKDKVRGTYDLNDYMTQRRALMTWWADHLDLLRQPQADNVVQLRAAQG